MATRRSKESQSTPSPASVGRAARPPRRKPSPAAAAETLSSTARAKVTPEARRGMIAEAAYLRAERRGFAPGHEVADWLAAEQEVDALLRLRHGGAAQ